MDAPNLFGDDPPDLFGQEARDPYAPTQTLVWIQDYAVSTPTVPWPTLNEFRRLRLNSQDGVFAALFLPGMEHDEDSWPELQRRIHLVRDGKPMSTRLQRSMRSVRNALYDVLIKDEPFELVCEWVRMIDRIVRDIGASHTDQQLMDASVLLERAEELFRRHGDPTEDLDQFMIDGLMAYSYLRGLTIQNAQIIGINSDEDL